MNQNINVDLSKTAVKDALNKVAGAESSSSCSESLVERVQRLAPQATFFRESPSADLLRVVSSNVESGIFFTENEDSYAEKVFEFAEVKPGAIFYITHEEVV